MKFTESPERRNELLRSLDEQGFGFPDRYRFTLLKKGGKFSIVFNTYRKKINLENIKFADTDTIILGGVSTCLEIHDVDNFFDFINILDRLIESWCKDGTK